jgi:hypothetical protein
MFLKVGKMAGTATEKDKIMIAMPIIVPNLLTVSRAAFLFVFLFPG